MIYLFLHISCTVLLFLIFRFFRENNINSFHSVVINYLVCVIIGLNFTGNNDLLTLFDFSSEWLPLAILTGALFVPTFYLMGLTVQKVNVSVATIANKMSLILPVLFSLMYLQKGSDHFSAIHLTGIATGITSIFLTSYKPEKIKSRSKISLFLFPGSIFFMGGLIDTLINYTNYVWLREENKTVYSLVLFTSAFLLGILTLTVKLLRQKQFLTRKDLMGGIMLGIPNYFSLFFLVKALSEFNNDGAVVFPVANIGVIVFASLLSVLLYKEKISGMNLAGICLSLVSVILVFW